MQARYYLQVPALRRFCDDWRRALQFAWAFPQEREELPTIGAAEQLGAETPVNGSRLSRGPVKQTLSG